MDEAIKDDNSIIEQDVSVIDSEEQAELPAERQLSKRELAMQAVVDSRSNQVSDNDGEPELKREIKVTDYDDELDDEPDNNELAVAEEKPSPVFLNEKGEYVMKLKINGVEVERSLDQITATAQKHEAADKRLQEAASYQRQLEDYEQRLRQQEQALAQKNTQLSMQDVGSDVSDEKIDSFLEQIYDGNTENARSVLKDILKGRQQPTLDPNELTARAKQEAIMEFEQRIQKKEYDNSVSNGVAWLSESHPEVMSDPMLYQFVDTQTIRIAQEEPNLTPEQVIKKATQVVLDKFGNQSTSSRDSNKAQLKPQPKRQAGTRYVQPQKEVVDNSPAAVIARQKAARNANRRSV